MKVAIYAMGTLGDVLPFAEVASHFQKNGLNVVIITNRVFEGVIKNYGIPVHVVTEPDIYNQTYGNPETWTFEGITDHYIDYHIPAIKPTFDFIASLAEAGERVCVISQSCYTGADIAAEKFGLKVAHIVLSPWSIHSNESPSFPLRAQVRESDRKKMMPGVTEKIREAMYRDIVKDYINPIRSEVGLEQWTLKTLPNIEESESLTAFFPDWFREVPSDWPKNIMFAGFVFPSRSNKESIPFFSDFVRIAGKPIIFTSGTGIWSADEEIIKYKEICKLLDIPGVYVNYHLDDIIEHTDESFLCLNYLDFSAALSRCKLFVHHGGIGTMAAGIAAGVPQLIRPLTFDQPDNAYWLWNLNIGNAVDRNASVSELVEAAKELLEDKNIGENLKLRKDQVASNKNFEDAAQQIITFFNPNVDWGDSGYSENIRR